MKKIKLSKKAQQRKRFIKNMLSSLILFETIRTTPTRARALKPHIQRLTNKVGTAGDEVSLKRYLSASLYGGAVQKAYDRRADLGDICIHKLSSRFGDGASQVLVKLNMKTVLSKTSTSPQKGKAKE